MQDLLARLGAYLERSDETLAGFIGSKPAAVHPEPKSGAVKTPARKPAFDRDALERAYLDATGGRKGVAARLAEVRTRLGDVPREDVDYVLAAIMLDPGKSRLLRIEDGRAITEADRAAALNFKGNVLHILWIEP
jgi:hypothetical protein